MRKNKIVKRKEIIFDLDEWAAVERKASEINITTSDYIRRMAVNEGHINHIDLKNAVPLMNALRVIGNNINQIARKANEINSICADDVQKIKNEEDSLCRLLSQFLSELQSKAA